MEGREQSRRLQATPVSASTPGPPPLLPKLELGGMSPRHGGALRMTSRGSRRSAPSTAALLDDSPTQVFNSKPLPHFMSPRHTPREQRTAPRFVATVVPAPPLSAFEQYRRTPGAASTTPRPKPQQLQSIAREAMEKKSISTTVRRDVHRFEARLGKLQVPTDPTNNSRRQQALLQRLFSLRLSENCFVKKELLRRGLDDVVTELGKVCSRYAMRLLTVDDFYIALSEALPPNAGDSVTVAETRLLFSLFDEDRSGIVDLDEFSEGLQLLLQDESIVLIAHCHRLVTDTHPPVDATVSALEIDLMFHAALTYYGGDGSIKGVMDVVNARLARRAHKGQVGVADFQQTLREFPELHKALCDLPESGADDEKPAARTPSPDPDEMVAKLAMMSRRRRDDDDDAGNDAAMLSPTSAQGGGRGIAYDVASARNLRFKGDEFKISDDGRQLAAEENHCPVWYSSRGQIWRVLDGQAPEPVLDV